MKTVRIGAGSGFWGDNLDPAIEIAKHGDVQYLAYDFLGEPRDLGTIKAHANSRAPGLRT